MFGKNKPMKIFERVAMRSIPRNMFDMTHDVKLSFRMGDLVPTFCEEVLPGDTWHINPVTMLRFAPLVAPIMHRVNVVCDCYFVPNRILWSEWEKFITGGDTGNDSPAAPYVQFETDKVVAIGSLADYLGFPTGTVKTPYKVNPFPMAAYLKIWDEYYRDQNLQDELTPNYILASGDNPDYLDWVENATLLKRAWDRDYLTAALPFAQKGDAVQVPLVEQTNIPVEYDVTSANRQKWVKSSDGTTPAGYGPPEFGPGQVGSTAMLDGDNSTVDMDPNGTYTVDVQAGATTIETLRRAFRLQEWFEKLARGGSRYVEQIGAHFGVRSSDARLQRPEFIGRYRQSMTISEVLSTADTPDSNTPVGQMAGHGISVGDGQFHFTAEEHGWILCVVNVQPTTAYQDGLPRKFGERFDRLDYAWPTFANLGEQPIKQKEVLAHPNTDTDLLEETFGYIPRYSEYKYANNRVAGEMRNTLDFWHLGRKFTGNIVNLNENFITCNPSTRIFAVTDPNEDHIFAHIINKAVAKRKLPQFGIPTI